MPSFVRRFLTRHIWKILDPSPQFCTEFQDNNEAMGAVTVVNAGYGCEVGMVKLKEEEKKGEFS